MVRIGRQSLGQIFADLKICFEKAVDCRRVVKETSEQWYAVGAVWPSSSESFLQYGVRISTFLEEGRLNMWPLLLRPVQLLVPAIVILLQEREKRMFPGVHLNCHVSLKCQVHLPAPEKVLCLKIPTLHLPWHLRLSEQKWARSKSCAGLSGRNARTEIVLFGLR